MAKVTITIEDTDAGAMVSWESDTGYVHEGGTQAEQIAFLTIQLLAKAGGVQLPTVPAGKGNN